MKKFIGVVLGLTLLTGCGSPFVKKDYVEPKISIGVEKQWGPTDQEKEQVAEAEQHETARKAEEARVAAEKAEQQRIADLEAENQLQQKRAEEKRLAEIERKQAEAAKQLAERLEREKRATPPAPPVAPPAPSSGYQWINAMQNQYGVFAAPGTQIIISDTNPCGGNAVGCTNYMQYQDGTKTDMKLYIAPSEVGSDPWILFHEIGHTQGITDECGADQFARKFLPGHAGAYC